MQENGTLATQGRTTLKALLQECNEAQQLMFKRMYSHNDLEKPIDDVVDQMPADKLDWAIQQAERTVEKNKA